MPIEVCAISGYSKTEGNSIAIKVDEEVVILDMGLSMENYIIQQDDREDLKSVLTYKQLLKANAVPNYSFIEDWKEKVIAIVPSHGHLDHVGAIPFAGPLFPKAMIIGTPYTMEILDSTMGDEGMSIPNQKIRVNPNSSFKISEKITLELINVTHSIPHSAIVVLHTSYGKVMYANDYKLDSQPTLGKRSNVERLQELGKEGIDLLIMECLYINEQRKMPSESVAKEMLKDVLSGINTDGKAIVITTFSSQIARLKSIVELGKKMNRKIVFIGRSLAKYVKAAEKLEIIDFRNEIVLASHRDKVEKIFKKINKEGREKYLLVCTGHQGEPKAVLARMSRGEMEFKFQQGDVIIFSCSIIPVELNKDNRDKLEKTLRSLGARVFRDVHVSGHGAWEDHHEMLEMVKPKIVIPSHAGADKAELMAELAKKCGVKKTKVMVNGERFVVK
jgi:ribonuclease J